MKLKGRVALVTGAGSGIGRAIAELFVEEGAEVWVNDVNIESAQATVKGLASPERGHAVRADVADVAQVRAMFAEVEKKHGRLDVLVNNAGISEVSKDGHAALVPKLHAQMNEMMAGTITTHLDVTMNLSDEDWLRMLAVHLNGTFYCTREALKFMSKVNKGSIVNVSSVAALMGIAASPHYGAAKGGIIGFTRSVAQEVATRNIRVNAICPGWIDTPMTQGFHADPMMAMMIRSRTPMNRFGAPREIAGAALFLASDDSSFVTGQYVSPNGGMFIG